MIKPGYPSNEADRLESLKATALLDSLPEERFDRITRLAARIFDVPTCFLSLVDSERQWFKSRVGMDACELGRDISFCGHAILEAQPLVVTDVFNDERFHDNPLVTGDPYIRFYAGAQVHDISGHCIGVLCLMDSKQRTFSDMERRNLRDFADLVEHEITNIRQEEYRRTQLLFSARMEAMLSTSPDIILVIDDQYRFVICNEHPDLLGPRHQVIGRTIEQVLPADLARSMSERIDGALTTDALIHHDYTITESGQSFEARFKKINANEVLVVVRNTTEQERKNSDLRRLSEVARQTTNGVLITDTQGLTVWINESFTKLTGWSSQDLIGKKPGELLQGKDTDPATVKVMAAALARHKGFNVDILNYSNKKVPYWVRIACNPLWGEGGELKGFIAIQSDINKERSDSELIRSSERMLRAVIDANSIGTWRLNLNTSELIINDKWATLLGYKLRELTPIDRFTWERLTHPDDLANCNILLNKHATGQIPAYEANTRMKHKNGSWVWINTRGRLTSRTPDGKAEWVLGTHFDVSAQIHAESSLNEQSMQMEAIVDNMLDGVISIDHKGIVLTFNKAAERIFGYSSAEVVGANLNMLMQSPHRDHHDTYIANFTDQGIGNVLGRNRELEALHKDGRVFPIELGLAQVERLGELSFIGIVRDITGRKQGEEEIRRLAFYDILTGLPNRRLLQERLERIIANTEREHKYAALIFLDMDNFKNLNDSAGHSKGDLLLTQIGSRLSHCVREGDTVSRLGGDEFVIVLESLGQNEQSAANRAEVVAEKILSELAREFDLDGLPYSGSASVGVTIFNNSDTSIEDLLKQADMAMYKAKAAGRNASHFFDPQMQVAVTQRVAMEQGLRDAIKLDQLRLFYQSQVDSSGHITGVEVLLRWLHPTKCMISPAQFIPLAEETGLILPIGEWVLEEACKTLESWSRDPLLDKLSLAVNISVVQFSKGDIVSTVLDALNRTGAPPHNLKLEITESLLANNFKDVKTKMLDLQRHGISFSIDDFGTGYSSLFYLKQLPINQLKIDQSFVRDIIHSANDRAIAQAVITLAEAMNLDVIAEGVETQEQLSMLASLGCYAYQGYLFGKPCELHSLDAAGML
ncbi:EAL domain-containing protein [Halopseudomonas sp.]|uniref:bifunctional diguanylate cyclase/phosphodiesterase n=1 Tax=Halopseudomonas sp. TaxID=2901191 RepID=UPI0035680F1D